MCGLFLVFKTLREIGKEQRNRALGDWMTIEATKQSETSLSQDGGRCGGDWTADKQTEAWLLTFRFLCHLSVVTVRLKAPSKPSVNIER